MAEQRKNASQILKFDISRATSKCPGTRIMNYTIILDAAYTASASRASLSEETTETTLARAHLAFTQAARLARPEESAIVIVPISTGRNARTQAIVCLLRESTIEPITIVSMLIVRTSFLRNCQASFASLAHRPWNADVVAMCRAA